MPTVATVSISPLVRAALDNEQEVRNRLHAELTAAMTGIETELTPAEALVRDRHVYGRANLPELSKRVRELEKQLEALKKT